MRGDVKIELEQYEEAIVDFNESIRLKPSDAEVYNIRGFTKIKLGQIESALIDFDQAISLDPTLAEAYHTRGEAQTLLGRTEEAKADFQKALELAEEKNNQELANEIKHSLQELDTE